MAGGIFISYRRDDSRHAAGRLVDLLGQTFGKHQLFMDVDVIEPGLDFVEVLNEKLAGCSVMLALIGPDWLEAKDASGQRQLDNPADFVRLEIEAALRRGIRVIPVLLDGASLPDEASLPDSLKPLPRRQAVRIAHERFATDADGLVRSLAQVVAPLRRPTGLGRVFASLNAFLSLPSGGAGTPDTSQQPRIAHKPIAMAVSGLISGLLTTGVLLLQLQLEWLQPIAPFFFLDTDGQVLSGFPFCVAIALGVWWCTGKTWALFVLPIATMYAWSAAVNVAIKLAGSGDPIPIVAGLAAGAVGAGLTHIGCALFALGLRRFPRILVTCAVGALAGMLLSVKEPPLLFAVWQPAVALCLGLGLATSQQQQPRSTLRA